jgi:single-strand DNA-binding protein
MASLNKVLLMGNLTREPEVRHTPSGSAVCELGLAVSRKYMSNNQEQEEVCFVDITVWGKQAESCGRYLEKGAPVLIEGRLQLDQWQDKTSGANRSKLRVVAERVQFMPRGNRDQSSGGGGNYQSNNSNSGGGYQNQSYGNNNAQPQTGQNSFGNNAPQSGQGYYKPPTQPVGGVNNAGAVPPQNNSQPPQPPQPPQMPNEAFDIGGKGAEDDIPF